VDDEAVYESGESLLSVGDRVIIFTDGVVEAQNAKEEEYGEARLLLKSPLESAAPASGAVDRFNDGFVGTAALRRHHTPRHESSLELTPLRSWLTEPNDCSCTDRAAYRNSEEKSMALVFLTGQWARLKSTGWNRR
jgi:hypothetical protein